MQSDRQVIDISVPLSKLLPVWPNGYGFQKSQLHTITHDFDANVSRVDYDVHCGTHIDAPFHFVADGRLIEDIPLDLFFGDCWVADFTNVSVITKQDLQKKGLPPNIVRILLKTSNSSKKWFEQPFDEGFIAINNDAAQYLVERGILLVGIDGPSIQRFQDPKDTHVTLLKNEIVILEGLYLNQASEGYYELICPPIKILNCEAMSARAVLREKTI